jgi:hypothetical protein
MNILALIVVGTFALSLVVSYPMMSLAQQQPEAGQQSQEQIDVPLNFSLKVKGGENAKDKNATEGGKDVTVTLKLRNSQNASPMDLPLTAKVSNDTKLQDIELCGAMTEGKEMCQSLEQFVSEKGQNQSSGASSKESSEGSSNSTDKNKDSEDN